jgi:LPXTG-motif cell wall-anchored protein
MSRIASRASLAGVFVCVVASLAWSQTPTSTTQTKDFEVIAVNGNTLVVQLPEGTRELTVPDSFRFTVNGQPMSVRELQPGMRGTATITTTTKTTPVTVTEVKNGEVVMTGPSTIYVRTGGEVKAFSESEITRRGVKLTKDGRPAQLSDFRPGDRLSARIVTSAPPKVVTEQEVQATLARTAPPATRAAATPPAASAAPAATPPPAPAATAGQSGAGAPPPEPAPSSAGARTLPRTASHLPSVGLIGFTALGIAAILSVRRRRRIS